MDFRAFLSSNLVRLDGGMGTLLLESGLPAGERPERWGLTHGDVITAIDSKAMTSSEMVAYVGDQEIGARVVLSIYRQGQTLEITVTIGEQIQSAQANQQR